jgi:hypothetical protein
MTNNRNFVVEAALDSLAENLDIDCSWIQVTGPLSQYPHLASFRNFTDDIHHEMSRIDRRNYFIDEVVGLKNKIVVPRLNNNDAPILSVFRKAGFRSLIAVPITTYKVLGIMGVAYRKKRTFSKDYINLFVVISNLVGMALNKDITTEDTMRQNYIRGRDSIPEKDNIKEIHEDKTVAVAEEKETLEDKIALVVEEKLNTDLIAHKEDSKETFQKHNRIMDEFRKSHSK